MKTRPPSKGLTTHPGAKELALQAMRAREMKGVPHVRAPRPVVTKILAAAERHAAGAGRRRRTGAQ